MIIGKQKIDIKKCLTQWKTPLALLFTIFLLFAYLILHLFIQSNGAFSQSDVTLTALNVIIIALVFFIAVMTFRDYIEPFMQLEQLTQAMLAGDLGSRILARKKSAFVPLSENINALATMLKDQSTQTEKQINDHLKHITEKTRSLQVLYDVAASVSQSQNINHLLEDYLHTLASLVGSESASVQIRTNGQDYKILAIAGEFKKNHHDIILTECFKNTQFQTELTWVKNLNQYISIDKNTNKYGLICIPLNYQNKFLGSYHFIINHKKNNYNISDNNLLSSIGHHISMAINQNRLRKESDIVRQVEERSNIANELHDSLAQTIASIRYQARVLDDSMHQENNKSAWHEMEKLENSIDEANTELRELIAHFKTPVHNAGFIPTIEQAAERFRRETGTTIYIQKQWPAVSLPKEYEIHILRIVQESLANIKKHAEANTVRILLLGDGVGNFSVLVEDDGNGFVSENATINAPGEHIGLSIMQERAQRINGSLKIESELEEGTHVMLSFSYQSSNLERD